LTCAPPTFSLAREVSNILFEHKPPRQAIADLMERELKAESPSR